MKSKRLIKSRRLRTTPIVVVIKRSFKKFKMLTRFSLIRQSVTFTISMVRKVLKKEVVVHTAWTIFCHKCSVVAAEESSKDQKR
jgi:hypothetical protein